MTVLANRRPFRIKTVIALFAVTVGLVTFVGTIGFQSFQPKTYDLDLMAFYCGGVVTRDGLDPYVVEPIRSCEHSIGQNFRHGSQLVVPDPLPPYDQAGFALLSRLPYADVQIAWLLLEIAAFILCTYLLSEMCALPRLLVGSSLGISDLYCSGLLGQLMPVCLLGIVLAGWALEKRSLGFLCAALVLVMVEPHVGLPIMVATAVFAGRLRWAAAIALACLAIATMCEPLRNVSEYLTQVVTAHALSEINNQEQLSLAYVLHLVGVPSALAVTIAKVQYAMMLLLGIVLVRNAAKAYGPAIVPFGAVSFVLIGGPFLHVTQVVAALPAALLMAGRSKSKSAAAAATLLAIPWLDYATVLTVLPIAVAVSYAMVRKLCGQSIRAASTFVVVSTSFIVASAFYVAGDRLRGRPAYGNVAPSAMAETTWRTLVDFDRHGHIWLSSLAKIPTEAALVIIIGLIARETLERQMTGSHVPLSRISLKVIAQQVERA